MDLSIVVPIYNEAENISRLHSEIKEVLDKLGKSYEILFINDGSTDETLKTLKEINSSDKTVKIVDLNRNFGQTAAVMAGFDISSGDMIITLDGDLQNDPADIPVLIDKLNEGFDLVSGWRKNRKDNLLLRVLPSKAANWLISRMLRVSLHDYGCTLKAYRKDVVKGLKLYGEMHRFIPAIADWKGAKITEVEVNHRKRKYGKTKYGINRTIKVFLDLILIAFLSEYSTKPIRFFGGLGLGSGFAGVATFLIVILMKFFGGTDMTGNPLLILSMLFLLVSIQFFSMGFLGEINIRTYYESQGKTIYHIREIIQ